MALQKKIYLVYASAKPERIKKRFHAVPKPIRWFYLGRDYVRLKEWEQCLSGDFERIHYATMLQERGMQWRQPYLDWIAQLGKVYNGLSWWSSNIAEKNTAVYSLYHNICYLYIAHAIGCLADSPLLIIAESKALLRTIALKQEFKDRVQWINKPSLSYEVAYWILRINYVWIRYLIEGILEIRAARKTKKEFPPLKPFSDKPRVLIHSCMDNSYFGEDGTPHDRYFTSLPDELRLRGYEVVVIPWLYNLKRSIRDAFKWFRQHQGEYLIPADYYTIIDYLWAALVIIRQIGIPSNKHVFQGFDITFLVQEARRLQACNTGAAKFVRYYRLIEKLKKKGVKINIFIDTFENMVPEKPQILGFRRFMPDVMTVGFQHYIAPYPLWLCLFSTPEESAIVPHPDIIVCNSKFTANLFYQNGFPMEKLRVGPSLRYMSLMKMPKKEKREKTKNTVLVVLTIAMTVVAETMHKLLEVFDYNEGIRFFIKVHPMMSENQWFSVMSGKRLPDHMERVDGPMNQWATQSTCAIVMVSTSALELLLEGIPVVMMGRETDFDMNPLAWFPKFTPPTHSPQELRDQVLHCLNLSQAEREDLQAWARKFLERAISPITDETISAFVQPPVVRRFSSTTIL